MSVDRDCVEGTAIYNGLDGPGSNPGVGTIFCTRPDRPSAHLDFYTMSTASFPEVKRLGCVVDHPPPSRTWVKKEIGAVPLVSFRPSCPVLG